MLEKMQNSKRSFGVAACAEGTEAGDSFVVYSSNAHDRLHVAIALHSTYQIHYCDKKNNTHPEVLLLMCLMMDISLEMFDLFRGHCNATCRMPSMGWHCRLRAMFTPPITGMRRRPLFPPGHLPSHPHLRDLCGKAHV